MRPNPEREERGRRDGTTFRLILLPSVERAKIHTLPNSNTSPHAFLSVWFHPKPSVSTWTSCCSQTGSLRTPVSRKRYLLLRCKTWKTTQKSATYHISQKRWIKFSTRCCAMYYNLYHPITNWMLIYSHVCNAHTLLLLLITLGVETTIEDPDWPRRCARDRIKVRW